MCPNLSGATCVSQLVCCHQCWLECWFQCVGSLHIHTYILLHTYTYPGAMRAPRLFLDTAWLLAAEWHRTPKQTQASIHVSVNLSPSDKIRTPSHPKWTVLCFRPRQSASPSSQLSQPRQPSKPRRVYSCLFVFIIVFIRVYPCLFFARSVSKSCLF